MKEQFFMVFVEGGNAPAYKHETFDSAKTEARRLSDKTDKKAYVLSVVDEVSPMTEEQKAIKAAEDYAYGVSPVGLDLDDIKTAFYAGVNYHAEKEVVFICPF